MSNWKHQRLYGMVCTFVFKKKYLYFIFFNYCPYCSIILRGLKNWRLMHLNKMHFLPCKNIWCDQLHEISRSDPRSDDSHYLQCHCGVSPADWPHPEQAVQRACSEMLRQPRRSAAGLHMWRLSPPMWHSLVPASGWACVTLQGGKGKEEAMACTTNMPDLSLAAPPDVALMAECAACRTLLALNMLLRQTLSLRKNVNVSNGAVSQASTACCHSLKKGYLSMQLVLLWDKWDV